MGNSIASDVERIECTVSVGQGIQCSASQNGSITIHTSTDSITILLQRIVNKKRIPFKSVSEHHLPAVLSSPGNSTSQASFWFAGNSELEDTRQDEGNDEPGDLLSSDDEGAPELAGEDDRADDTNATNSDGSNNRRSVQKKQETPISDEELTEICRKLASRTLKKWNSKQRQKKKSLDAVLSDWPTFFGYTSYASLEQWSYRALDTSEKFGTLQQPFHKVILANWWNECLQQRTPKNIASRVKARMLSALEPGFEKLESKEKDAKRKQIDRYVVQGEVISLMLAQTPGLVITVSDLITTAEYALQSSLILYH
ncbi:hypothetical protein J4E91_011303 [Alternaria rosae]|nr:hypothetical protein J4E91_011303 [Alternaria rosae]